MQASSSAWKPVGSLGASSAVGSVTFQQPWRPVNTADSGTASMEIFPAGSDQQPVNASSFMAESANSAYVQDMRKNAEEERQKQELAREVHVQDSDSSTETNESDLQAEKSVDVQSRSTVTRAKAEEDRFRATMINGDPLSDLPAPVEGGNVVALLRERPGLDNYMSRYGIDMSKTGKRKSWYKEMRNPWIQWFFIALYEAKQVVDDEDALGGKVPQDVSGLRKMMRDLSVDSITGKRPEGSVQISWVIFQLICRYVVMSGFFRNFFGFLIVFNTVYMGFRVDKRLNGVFFDVLDHIFVALFLIEIIVRMTANSTARIASNNGFFFFDATIVLISVIHMWILPIFVNLKIGIDLKVLQAFRILRILRLARLLKISRWVRPFRIMERSMRRGVGHFMSVMTLLLAIIFTSSLLFRAVIRGYSSDEIWGALPERDYNRGTLHWMMYTLEALLCGFTWTYNMADPMLQSKKVRAIGIMFVTFMYCLKLALFNLIIGSMIENFLTTMKLDTREVAREELEGNLRVNEVKQFLDDAESRIDGRFSWEEFETFALTNTSGPRLLNILGIRLPSAVDERGNAELTLEKMFETHRIDEKAKRKIKLEMRKIYQSVDVSGEENIPTEDFVLGYVKLKGIKKNLENLFYDFMLRQVLRLVRSPSTSAQWIEHKMSEIDNLLERHKKKLQIDQIDFKILVEPTETKCAKLDSHIAKASEALQPPTKESSAVTVACANVTHFQLQTEIRATRESALAFLKFIGKCPDIDAPVSQTPTHAIQDYFLDFSRRGQGRQTTSSGPAQQQFPTNLQADVGNLDFWTSRGQRA